MQEFFQGAEQIIPIDEQRWSLHRLNAAQERHYAQHNDRWLLRSHCPAGIRWEAFGRLSSVTCRIKVAKHCRSFASIDLLCDGTVIGHVLRPELQIGDDIHLTIPIQDDGEPHHYALWLPTTVAGPISIEPTIIAGKLTPAPAAVRKLLTIGDSITQGMVSDGPAGSYAALLARSLGADLRNHAIGGHIFDADAMAACSDWQPDAITVAYGTNDWAMGRDEAAMTAAAASTLERICQLHPDTPVVVLTPLWRENEELPREKSQQNLRQAVAGLFELPRMLNNPNISVIDGLPLVPHHRRFTTDGLHPNDLGMLHVAHGVLPTLRNLLD
jgi:lysophospholipase L1-like esterase